MNQFLKLTTEEKELLLEALFQQNMSKEIVASAIKDLEINVKKGNEDVLKKLSSLYDRLDQAGC